jgi:hypothetical protein
VSGDREVFGSIFLAPHATAEVPNPFKLKLWTLATPPAFDYDRKNLSLGARLWPAEASREARAGRAGGLPGPRLARAPTAPVRSGALCAARRCFWQNVWFALEAPFRVQHLLPCSSGKLHRCCLFLVACHYLLLATCHATWHWHLAPGRWPRALRASGRVCRVPSAECRVRESGVAGRPTSPFESHTRGQGHCQWSPTSHQLESQSQSR